MLGRRLRVEVGLPSGVDVTKSLLSGNNFSSGALSSQIFTVGKYVKVCLLSCEDAILPNLIMNSVTVSRNGGNALLGYLQHCIPDLSPEEALRLELGEVLDEVDQLAAVCLLSTGLMYIWETRVDKKLVTIFKI